MVRGDKSCDTNIPVFFQENFVEKIRLEGSGNIQVRCEPPDLRDFAAERMSQLFGFRVERTFLQHQDFDLRKKFCRKIRCRRPHDQLQLAALCQQGFDQRQAQDEIPQPVGATNGGIQRE